MLFVVVKNQPLSYVGEGVSDKLLRMTIAVSWST